MAVRNHHQGQQAAEAARYIPRLQALLAQPPAFSNNPQAMQALMAAQQMHGGAAAPSGAGSVHGPAH